MKSAGSEVRTVEFRFKRPCRALSENEARGMHWAEVRRRLEPWREAVRGAVLAAHVERANLAKAPCTVEMDLPFADTRRRDPSNFIGTVVKACVDQLVHHRVWPDDSPEWVRIVDPRIVVGDEVVIRLIPRLQEKDRLGSRAVLRSIEPGNSVACAHCGQPVKFSPWKKEKGARQQVIANVYIDGRWNRVEHFHSGCYDDAEEPYGKATA